MKNKKKRPGSNVWKAVAEEAKEAIKNYARKKQKQAA